MTRLNFDVAIAGGGIVALTQDAIVLSSVSVQELEPGLRLDESCWALLHQRDGWVDNASLIESLWKRVGSSQQFMNSRSALQELTATKARFDCAPPMAKSCGPRK